jgi:hypothetical protein
MKVQRPLVVGLVEIVVGPGAPTVELVRRPPRPRELPTVPIDVRHAEVPRVTLAVEQRAPAER